jgi:hypothetical protein
MNSPGRIPLSDDSMRRPAVPDSGAPVPPAAAWLGAAGLLPFLAGAIGLWAFDSDVRRDASLSLFLGYSAVILSFMGAVHWGLAIARGGDAPDARAAGAMWRPMALSVLPALLAWLALGLPPAAALVLFAAGFLAVFLGDLAAIRHGMAPPWYARLRLPLSATVVACQLATLAAISG